MCSGANVHRLQGYSDANFTARRSTTGYTILYGGAAILSRTRKAHCIAMSTCEAELMALASLALDMMYVMNVLMHLGVRFDDMPEASARDPESLAIINKVHAEMQAGVPEANTDSKSAHDLCHRNSAGSSTRHVERRVFKMRELVGARKINLVLVRTAEMWADFLTKLVDLSTFERCRSKLMNLPAAA